MSEDRYMIIPCEGADGQAIIWDRLEEQVFDVIDAKETARLAAEDSLWNPSHDR